MASRLAQENAKLEADLMRLDEALSDLRAKLEAL
jgi:hypothetical protein